ncbi:hypothetical protein ACFOSV_00905 [Algoriphagus namhaensis]|uniref:PepSY domain-containing protein n=1 Tax=Algoriphagus namhaensis TaxID=915353 RepID=A0ABV8APM7_9BACT
MKNLPYLVFALALSFLFAGFGLSAKAQDKVEREKKVKKSEVPSPAKKWLKDAFETLKSPKWYLETNESGYSYEAKFKWNDQYYSVEFDSLGVIEDVEIELNFEELAAEVQQNLNQYFSEGYKNYKIRRLQIQYSGHPDDLEDLFDENEMEGLEVRYEIEFVGTDIDGLSQFWEGLFDEKGVFISRRKIITPPNENLIF